MHKRLLIINLIAHLLVPFSLMFPILQIEENASSLVESSGFFNIFDFIRLNQYIYITVLLIALLACELFGGFFAIYGLTRKEIKHLYINVAFLLGFSSAVLGAMFISAGSYTFFVICAISFLLTSYSSIKLMKLEE